jgi:hypothetical protein
MCVTFLKKPLLFGGEQAGIARKAKRSKLTKILPF